MMILSIKVEIQKVSAHAKRIYTQDAMREQNKSVYIFILYHL